MTKPGRVRRKAGDAIATVIVIALLMLLFVASILFFKVNTIEVLGNKTYTSEEIIASSGIKKGESLIFLSVDSVSNRIRSDFLCVRNVTVRKTMPSKVSLIISETKPVAVITVGAEKYTIDETCRVLSQYDPAKDTKLASLRGITVESAKPGYIMSLSPDDAGKTEYLSEILEAAISNGAEEKINWIDLSSISGIRLLYDSRLTAELGSSENAEYKLRKLVMISDKLDPGAIGVVRLSKDGEAVFSPI